MQKIKSSTIQYLKTDELHPHPQNRPLGLNQEKIEQLKNNIQRQGFRENTPLLVRPYDGSFQIISGEHRFNAAKELEYETIPCVVEEMTDEQALVELYLNNIQTEPERLSIGLQALEYTRYPGRTIREYAEKAGIGEATLNRFVKAAKVYSFINETCSAASLNEVLVLCEIGKTNQQNWLTLSEIAVEKETSTRQMESISKLIRELDELNFLFDDEKFLEIKKQAAIRVVEEKEKKNNELKAFLIQAQKNADNLQTGKVYQYSIETDEITEKEEDWKGKYIQLLKQEETLTGKQADRLYSMMLTEIKSSTKEAAEADAKYYRDEKNQKMLEEQRRLNESKREEIFSMVMDGMDALEIAKELGEDPDNVQNIIFSLKADVVYADPPWEYDNSGLGGSAEKHYDTMGVDEICGLPVDRITRTNSVLFLWATNPLMKEALQVMEAWGFEYKTNFVWVKEKQTYGKLGFYNYGQHEFLLIGVKGSKLPDGEKPTSIIKGKNDVHSKKPDVVYNIIEKMYPNSNSVELFARNTKRKGWIKWGNEVNKYE